MKNNKIPFLINQFKLTEDEAKKISAVCNFIKIDKYIVWLAKEYKKDNDVLNNVQDLIYIFDWVKRENVDVLKYDFSGMMKGSQQWHGKNFALIEKENNIKANMEDGVFYKCKDKKHFFKILSISDLDEESDMMGNCIRDYTHKLKDDTSILISLRDEKNLAHVDIEIDSKTAKPLQVMGKAVNGKQSEPIKKYKDMMLEYAYHMLSAKDDFEEEIDL